MKKKIVPIYLQEFMYHLKKLVDESDLDSVHIIKRSIFGEATSDEMQIFNSLNISSFASLRVKSVSLLHIAAKHADYEVISSLVFNGAKLDGLDIYNRSPLDVAHIYLRGEDIIRLLNNPYYVSSDEASELALSEYSFVESIWLDSDIDLFELMDNREVTALDFDELSKNIEKSKQILDEKEREALVEDQELVDIDFTFSSSDEEEEVTDDVTVFRYLSFLHKKEQIITPPECSPDGVDNSFSPG